MLGARRLLGALRLCSSVSCPRPRATAKLRVRDALGVQDASGECVTVQVGLWKDCCLSLPGSVISYWTKLGQSKVGSEGISRAHTSGIVLLFLQIVLTIRSAAAEVFITPKSYL